MRGRKPKAPELKLLAGERADRVNKAAPKAVSGRPVAPAHLGAVAAAEWARIVDEIAALGVLSASDRAALSIYCVAFERWIKAREVLEAKGLVIETPLGGVKPNPAAAIAATAEATMGRILAEFGLTAASRNKVSVPDKGDGDQLGQFLATRKAK